MRILVIGSGGREHALVWKLANSQKVSHIYCAPGNGGIEALATCVPIDVTDTAGLIQFVQENQIELTVVGPEVSLLAGIVDAFEAKGLKIFGPRQAGARIEGSKRFAKELMRKYAIPTATFRSFTDVDQAREYVRVQKTPMVIKADGLAAGKGVVIAQSVLEADQVVVEMMQQNKWGDAGHTIVIEEFLAGEEISLMAFTDGKTITPMVVAQDHKRAYDGDEGPNTGGMGAYSPVPQISQTFVDQAVQTILQPIVKAFQQEQIDYRGVLYAGLIVTPQGPKVIRFNAHFGDPETQVVLPRMETDLVDVLLAVVEGRLAEQPIRWKEKAVVCVVMAAKGYPGTYQTGDEIIGLSNECVDWVVFHAGTRREQGQMLTTGGRVLGVTAFGEDLAGAKDHVYQMIQQIHFQHAYYRTDIAAKAL